MNGKDISDSAASKPCWEGVALGWRRDVPDSLRLRSGGGDSLLSRCQGDPGLVLQSDEEPASLSSIRLLIVTAQLNLNWSWSET